LPQIQHPAFARRVSKASRFTRGKPSVPHRYILEEPNRGRFVHREGEAGRFTYEEGKADALLTKNQSGRARFRHSVLRFEDFHGLDFCQAQIPVARTLRLRLKVENGHRSTILFSCDAKEAPVEDSYASLRISLQKVWREFHPHNDNQRARQKTGSMPPLQRH
jgi:hypothetical protein